MQAIESTQPFTHRSLLDAYPAIAFVTSIAQPAGRFCPCRNSREHRQLGTVYVTAERQLQQSLGVSKISAQDLEKQPVVNDISDLVRTMPGVNLTGNTATGQRGNKRQIDLRGMGRKTR